MEREEVKSILESLLFVADGPQNVQCFADALESIEPELIQEILNELQSELAEKGRGDRLVEVAGGYQLRTAKGNAESVKKFLGGRPARMGRSDSRNSRDHRLPPADHQGRDRSHSRR